MWEGSHHLRVPASGDSGFGSSRFLWYNARCAGSIVLLIWALYMMSAAFLACLCAPKFGVFWCMVFASWEGYQEPLGEFACKSPASDRQSHPGLDLMAFQLFLPSKIAQVSPVDRQTLHGTDRCVLGSTRNGVTEAVRVAPSQRMIPLANNIRNSSVLCMSVEAHLV